ncbi:uncharacterized protein GGS22DRAFT_51594 [Annulohypoxylon maeteangense]|uniref:uncharacterized protein n=1 Tax=Annulohypoxylon maeteangense TaxID=1927788 RepID=UPI0020083A07|nr:uncharacterized protein GGS22DRAFT_51594 [Annulohypoxylon maeteangense]KAI0881865.1 hypothetical protein GGS22DRAFT_51594 [Annulohypoxylon maeteangense]
MARLVQAPLTQNRVISNPDALNDLNRLLARLQENILHADADRERRLRASEYDRSKARVNIEYARTIVTKLEQDALAIKVHSRRQEVQADLNQKREILDQVTERFQEFEDVSVDSDDDSSEGEDLLGGIIATPSESVVSGEAADQQVDEDEDDAGEEQNDTDEQADESILMLTATTSASSHQATTTDTAPQQTSAGTSTSQTLRARGNATQPDPTATIAIATDKGETTALRTELFGNRTSPTNPTTATATTEAIIDHHRSEQDKLTESMVGMARALKESSRAFASSLQEDTDVLRAAGQNLDRNERGLGAVAGRMGTLRRMTEGTGWWGRVLLYGYIAGLAVFALVLVFVLPKLRF